MSYIIVLEGLDAAGKATQAKHLVEKLDSIGRNAVLFSFPRYETEVGKAIKRLLTGDLAVVEKSQNGDLTTYPAADDALILQSLMLADKSDAVHEMDKAIENGAIVVCDRWMPSALCFGEADGLDPVWLQRIQSYLPVGDLNLFIDVPEEEGLKRRPQMRDRYERDREKQKVIRANYETLWIAGADEEPEGWAKIDGVGTEEEVAARIWGKVAELLESE